MRLTIHRNDLLAAVGHARAVVQSRVVIPICGHLHLAAEGESLTITGMDMDRQAADRAPAGVAVAGAATLPADLFAAAVKSLPETDVSIAHDAATRVSSISAGRSRFRLAGLPPDDFPSMADTAWVATLDLPCATLRRLISEPAFAAGTDEHRPYLGGCWLVEQLVDGHRLLRSWTMDGHRMIVLDHPIPDGVDGLPQVLIPRQAQIDMGRMLDGDGTARLMLSASCVGVERGEARYISKLIEARMPDMEAVIAQQAPTPRATRCTVDRNEIAAALRRVASIVESDLPVIDLHIRPAELALGARRGGVHDVADAVSCETSGPTHSWGCNAGYLAQQIDAMRGERIIIEVGAAGSAYRLLDTASPGDVHIIMPMRPLSPIATGQD